LKQTQHFESSLDTDRMPLNGQHVMDYALGSEAQMKATDGFLNYEDDKLVKYCIVISLVLHLMLFASFSRMAELMPTKAFLKPGEQVTSVRLLEQQPQENKTEPPPQQVSALSDRNHTAAREKIPKLPPTQVPPLGKMEPVQKRIAALIPPQAPEDLSGPSEEKSIKEDQSRPPTDDKSQGQNKFKAKQPADLRNKRKDLASRKLDLKPTQQEQEIAAGLTSPGGAPDFFPDGDTEEAVVDINTREEKFFSYLLHLKRKIQGVWVYPSSAANSGIGGTLTVEFSIARDGELVYVNLVDSSGHPVLDESATRAIRSAAPYFPFPQRMRAKRLRIKANFIYITSNYFRRIM